MFACSFYEHLDYPNCPHLCQTKEDNNNEEAQSWVPGNQAGVTAFSHTKKSLKPLNGIFCPSQTESLARVPVENIAFQLHTGADGNFVMAQWCRKKPAVRFNKVTSRHRNLCKICSSSTSYKSRAREVRDKPFIYWKWWFMINFRKKKTLF